MRKNNYKNNIICGILMFVLLLGNFIVITPKTVQAKTYNASGEWHKVEKNGTDWSLSISIFTAPESDNLAGSCTFSCLANLGPRFSQVLYIDGDVYKISENKYKCRFTDSIYDLLNEAFKKMDIIIKCCKQGRCKQNIETDHCKAAETYEELLALLSESSNVFVIYDILEMFVNKLKKKHTKCCIVKHLEKKLAATNYRIVEACLELLHPQAGRINILGSLQKTHNNPFDCFL